MTKRRPVFFTPTLESLEDRVTPSTNPLVMESFDTTALGALPTGWSQWQNTGGPVFAVNNTRALSPSRGISATASIAWTAARAWVNQPFSPNIEVSAAVFTNSAIPVQILARASGLGTANEKFYTLSVKQGLEVKLQSVVGGTTTTLDLVQSKFYLSNQWVRATFNLMGTTLRAQIFRVDTNQYLAADGSWQAAPTWALTVNDSAITAGSNVGLARPGSYTGSWYADDFQVYSPAGDEIPPNITLSAPAAALGGTVALTPAVTDNVGVTRVEFYVDGGLRATDTAGPYTFNFDSSTAINGPHTLTVKAYDVAGNVGILNLSLQTLNANSLPDPVIPANFNHVRVAQLIYSPTQLDAAGVNILQNDVDLVITDSVALSQQVHAVAPGVTQLLYTNVSTIYQSLLTDWLTYADRNGMSREDAFYHVKAATPFSGNSPSSQPVNWFWSVLRGASTFTDLTFQAHGATTPFNFGAAGESVYVGYLEKFREINLTLSSGAAFGWSGMLEYPTAVDAQGRPTQWAPLTTLTDSTGALARSGQITFDPPADWKAASPNGGVPMYYVRIRTVTGGQPPAATRILGRDYVNARGTESGTVPAFDYAADSNHDGYLNNAEYATRAAGKDARFAYEGRSPFSTYGQMRFATNPGNLNFRAWAADYMKRLLQSASNSDGLFIDNSNSPPTLPSTNVVESLANYATDYATLMNKIAVAVGPTKLVMPNTYSSGVIQQTTLYFEELALKPLSHTFDQFESVADKVATWQASRAPSPLAVLDVDDGNGSPTDPRTQLAALAYYYLLADPQRTFIDPFGGNEPGSSLTRHWFDALSFNVGRPVGTWSLRTQGQDPANAAYSYHVYQRSYTNALVLFKPLSENSSGAPGTTADNTATTVALGGNCRLLRADGSLSGVVTSVSLRNGEGAILVKA